MRPAAQVQATIELLEEVFQSGFPADRLMAQYFRTRRYIGSKDKAVISEQLYTVLRNKLSYEYLLNLQDISSESRFLVAVMLRFDGIELETVFDSVGHNPKAFAESTLETLNNLDLAELEKAPAHVRLNVPEWLAPKLQAALGEERYEPEMTASNQRAHTDIRINLLQSTVSQTQHQLAKAGYTAEATELSPWGLRFKHRVALFALPVFKQGWFEVQDQGSQLLALVSAVKAGDKVVDFCAGAGGKTLAMAAMMQNKGTIYACDVHSKRLEQLSKRAKRAGAHNIRTHVLSSENDKWVKKHRAIADVVLIDAPCTGTGTWRRSPDSRWKLTPQDLQNLVNLQQSILNSAARLLKPGGTLFYATCSLLNEENEDQIETFLAGNADFEATQIKLSPPLSEHLHKVNYQGHQLRSYPALSSTDGFYVCALRRKSHIPDYQ